MLDLDVSEVKSSELLDVELVDALDLLLYD